MACATRIGIFYYCKQPSLANVSVMHTYTHPSEEDGATVDMDNNKREDFTMGLLLIRCDNTATMMDALPPLLAHCPPTHRELPLKRRWTAMDPTVATQWQWT